MKKQKVMSQIKEQEKLYEVEIGNLPGKEFRIMIVEDDPGYQENNDEDTRNVYQRHTRTKGQTEMNNTLEGIHSRITEAEEWINDLGGQNGGNHGCKTKKRRQPKRTLGQH